MQDEIAGALTDLAATPLAMQISALAVAAAIGFLIGFEREWSHHSQLGEGEDHPRTFAGARTFTLSGAMGCLSPDTG